MKKSRDRQKQTAKAKFCLYFFRESLSLSSSLLLFGWSQIHHKRARAIKREREREREKERREERDSSERGERRSPASSAREERERVR